MILSSHTFSHCEALVGRLVGPSAGRYCTSIGPLDDLDLFVHAGTVKFCEGWRNRKTDMDCLL
jgi:hypothetical protein